MAITARRKSNATEGTSADQITKSEVSHADKLAQRPSESRNGSEGGAAAGAAAPSGATPSPAGPRDATSAASDYQSINDDDYILVIDGDMMAAGQMEPVLASRREVEIHNAAVARVVQNIAQSNRLGDLSIEPTPTASKPSTLLRGLIAASPGRARTAVTAAEVPHLDSFHALLKEFRHYIESGFLRFREQHYWLSLMLQPAFISLVWLASLLVWLSG